MSEKPIHHKFIRMPMFELEDSSEYDFNRQMQLIAARYEAEEKLLAAIAAGDEAAAFAAFRSYGTLMQNPEQEPRPTSSDALRDFKNSLLVIHLVAELFNVGNNHGFAESNAA